VPRQEDIGFDYYCTLSDQEKGKLTFGYPFLVQIKSISSPIFAVRPADTEKYHHTKGVVPDHLAWLFKHELPLYLGLVDKEDISIRLYSLAPLWFIYYHKDCRECSAIKFVPRLDPHEAGLIDVPKRMDAITKDPISYTYEVDLGYPIAAFSAKDTEDDSKLTEEKNRLRYCIDYEQKNFVFFRADLPHFYWFAETDRKKKRPIPAFYYDEAPDKREYLDRIYSFVGPALIPLALRYRVDKKHELLTALRTLYHEMPPNTIPETVKKALPEIFDKH
jgi:hypothetical protein